NSMTGGMPGGGIPGGMGNRIGGGMTGGVPGGFRPAQGGFQQPNNYAQGGFQGQQGMQGQSGMPNQGGMGGFQQRPGQPMGGVPGGMNNGMQNSMTGGMQNGMNQGNFPNSGGFGQNQNGMNQGMNAGMNYGMNQQMGNAPMNQGMNAGMNSGMNPTMNQGMNPQMQGSMQNSMQNGMPGGMGMQNGMSGTPEQTQVQPQTAPAPQPVPVQTPSQTPSQTQAPQQAPTQVPPQVAPQVAQSPAPQPTPTPASTAQAPAPTPQPKLAPKPVQKAAPGGQPAPQLTQKPVQRPAGTPGQAPSQRPAGTPQPRPAGSAPQQRPAGSPTARPVQRPQAQVAPRPAQRPQAAQEAPKPAPQEQRGIRVRQVPQRPGAAQAQERPRYRAPEPRPQIRPEMDRPERCYWGFPEQPPFTCDARPMRNAPVVDEKGRLVMVSQGKLFCLDITHPEPEVVWEYMIQSHVPGPIVVDQNGDYHLHAMDGYLHMVTKDGKQSYRPVQVGEPLGYAAPIVDGWGNTLISNYNGGLIRVNSQGQKDSRPYFRSRAKLDSAGVIAGGVLYIGSEDGYLFAIDLDDAGGRSLWDQGKEVGYAGGFLNSSPAIAEDGTIIVATRAERLLGFNSVGEVLWTTYMPGQLLGSPVIDANGNIYVGASMSTRQGNVGYLVCVDGTSHKIRWQFETDDMIESTPCIGDDGTIYFGNNAGWLYALNSFGDKKWAAKFEAGIRSAGTIVAPQLLTFALDDDVLVGVRCESQELCEKGWAKLGHDNFHSFLGPVAPPKPLSENAPE
ncbi:MAG: PQQ-binding-like beta-propeller repeat protein, partial [Planctomycetia bacterium]|nr:PQQ-binding-like beta-propeller repeat protein [Planctomycetia bacterium]